MKTFDYSVVIPVYGGKDAVSELVDRIFTVLESTGHSVQVVLVDDAGPHGSWKVIPTLVTLYPGKVKAIRLARNSGQQSATLCGIHHATGKWIITMDDDLQHLPEEIPALIARQEQTAADMVYGIFPKKHHSLLRNIGSRMFNWSFAMMASTSGNGSSFRLIRGSVCKGLMQNYHRHMLLDEVLSWHASTVAQVNVRHGERENGESGYSSLKLVIMTVNYVVNYTVLPLRIMTFGGLLFSFLNLCIGLYFIYEKLYADVALGFTSIIVAIFFSTSLMLLCLGIIGEYISRMYVKDWNRPQYLIGEIRE
ncbi:MAG: glycosyltransferase family 2 protein [Flavobacteriales bacterium]|nr:glycosyltransferase family 2 protein [Flavobacteriales bacterium]